MSPTQPDGYLALPPTGKGDAVLVLHPWWGLNDTIKSFTKQLADARFVAFAPDLYHGKIATTIPEAETLSSQVFENLDRARSDLATATAFLNQRDTQAGRKLAVIGFSLGAFFALDLSVSAPELFRSVVVFYGTHPGEYTTAQAEYLGHFAETDEFESQTDVDNLQASLARAGRPFTFYQYPGTRHWFVEPDRPEYVQPAATLAWERTLAFLKHSSDSWVQSLTI